MSVGVTLDQVTKAYRLGDGSLLRAADDVSVSLAAGRRTALIGASGSGKSTLLHLMGAIDVPDSGTITVGDEVITGRPPRWLADYRSRIGFVFQQFHLLPALTLLDNVCAPLVGRPFDGNKRERGREVLDAVGLAGRESALPSQLSGGQQQRVAIARALVAHPMLLLADEPTGNLDAETSAGILDLIGDLHQRYGTTVVIATHDTEVAAICDDVLRIERGHATPLEPETASTPRHAAADL
ncbi:ABC transporter ATP-binding protein [Tessaracoccus caeni]|uniref:ABC transporter ATP-binding protein n=1 Tax=Tessaracoccus caeni TaxID=3031239 RepID=UPI0023DAAC06|nr:ABC transporter ATP-binding protein [Tessaracoccus caeni]MDF1489013.1 ABC transporter ATP-binding protein [Tessaracoccus caeni]